MPTLDDKLHLQMFGKGKTRRGFRARLRGAIRLVKGADEPKLEKMYGLDCGEPGERRRLPARIGNALRLLVAKQPIYGMEWGDPDKQSSLRFVRDHFLLPYLTPQTVAVEIGVGGGRWTRYMLDVSRVYAVDYHQEFLDELQANFSSEAIVPVKNNGYDFPGIPDGSVDFIFSFGTFVHLDLPIIAGYLRNMKRLLKRSSSVFIQYADKTKPAAKRNKAFSDNDPERMRQLILANGYQIYEEDTERLHHSSMILFGIGDRKQSPT